MAANKSDILKISIAAIALLIGGFIYIIFRPETLIMFSWFDSLGMSNIINKLRNLYGDNSIYSWVKYNMPAALWLFSYLYVIDAIWTDNKNTILYKSFLLLMPCIAVASEFMQLFRIIPGTYDTMDVVSYIFAIITFYIINNKHLIL